MTTEWLVGEAVCEQLRSGAAGELMALRLHLAAMPIIAALAMVVPERTGLAQPAMQADGASPEAMQRAFVAMMAQPGDPGLAVQYARLAAARGDSRAAIAALERVLRINPALDNIRLELASLHLATGSPDLAALYARQALASPNVPPEVEARGRRILALAERSSQRSLLDMNVFAGVRWDSNANGVTPAGTVPIFVPGLGSFLPAQLPSSGKSDWSSVLGARLQHRYDLELQREGTWETNASLFDQRFARIPRAYDLTVASFDTGPRIGVIELGDDALIALRPFVTANWLGYADETYAWLYGGGLTAELRLGTRWSFELTALGRMGSYENSDFRPSARDYTGTEGALSAGVTYALTPVTRLSANVSYLEADARRDFYARSGLGGQLGVQTLLQVGGWEIGAAARAGARRLNYRAPDPVLDPFQKREDTRWEAGATLILPIGNGIATTLEYDWFNQRSNYEIYRFDSHSVILGLRASF